MPPEPPEGCVPTGGSAPTAIGDAEDVLVEPLLGDGPLTWLSPETGTTTGPEPTTRPEVPGALPLPVPPLPPVPPEESPYEPEDADEVGSAS